MYSLEELKKFFENDTYATNLLGAEIIDANNDYARCMFKITSNHKNAKDIVMGGAIFSLADFTSSRLCLVLIWHRCSCKFNFFPYSIALFTAISSARALRA